MNPSVPYEAIIIGGGKAGKTLAMDLGNHGVKTALIERDAKMIGGTCINLACIPTKSFVQSARVAHTARHAGDYGVEVGDVRVNWLAVRRRVEGITKTMREMNYKSITAAPALDLIIATARLLDRNTVEIQEPDGKVRQLIAKRIFLNTGTRPAEAQIPGMQEVSALDSNTVQRLDKLPDHLIIVGGGYIALEFAQMFRRFGSNVTIVVRGERILPHEDTDVVAAVSELLKKEGIAILTGVSPIRAEKTAGGVALVGSAVGGEQTISGSHLLVAIGRAPNTENLNLAAAGVDSGEHGYIKVNDRLETTAPNIWALGDCNGGPQFTHASLDDYRIVKANVFGKGERSTKHRLMPSTLFIDPELARIGLTETEAREQGFAIRVAKASVAVIPRARTTGQLAGQMKAVIDAKNDRILGCSILASEAGEMLGTVQMAMIAGLPFTALRDAVLSHPTMTEGFNSLFADSAFLK
jgi:pyruvate/2-oxoglutarate dehydrogenase complex dihydrolipoamide dehydrogenase (E3) component